MKGDGKADGMKKTLYRLKYESTKSSTNVNYERIRDMERQETELLEKLKQTQQTLAATE